MGLLRRTAIVSGAIALAMACAPILGIDDITYGPPPAEAGAGDGPAQGDGGGEDAPIVCKGFELRCGSECVNPEDDPRNCNACGYDCGGGACSQRRCQPEILASGLYSPHGLVTDGEWIYATLYGKDWTLFPSPPVGSVIRIPVDGGVPEGGAPETLVKDLVKPSFIRIVGDRLVWTTNDGLMASLRDGGARVTEPDAGETFDLVVDGDLVQAARISGGCAVYSWRLPGGDGGAVPPPRPVPCGRWLAQAGERLFGSITKNAFVDGGGGIAAFARDGTGPVVEYGSRPSWAVAVEGDYVYFTEERPKDGPGSTDDSPTAVRRMLRDGGGETVLANGLYEPRMLIVDPPSGSIFVGEFYVAQAKISRIPIDGGTPSTVVAVPSPMSLALVGGFLYWAAVGSPGQPVGEIGRIRVR
ncbi:MAG: hypothetical protein JST00_13650 [Deltaproteobacteria bacterium]|nr:hypothetical protein [Deltaproteobacteria bacterium]